MSPDLRFRSPVGRSVLVAVLTLGLLPDLVPDQATAQQPVAWTADSGVDHFDRRQRVRALYEAGEWERAMPLLEALAAEAPEDGGLWFRLGRVRHRLGDRDGAIAAYRRSLDTGYRYGSWTAYQVARLYGTTGRSDSALTWLGRALERRWDDRPGIAGDTAFTPARSDPRFQQLAASGIDPRLSRDEAWRQDVDYLVAEAKRMHAAPARPAHSATFVDAAADLKGRIPQLSNDQIVLELARLLALLGDGHTGLYGPGPDSPFHFSDRSLPLLLHGFADGLYVIDAIGPARQWIGARVLRFGDISVDSALAALTPYVHQDNRTTVAWLGIRFRLPSLTFLRAIGATADPARARLTLVGADGERREVTLEGGDHARAFRRKLRPPPGPDAVPLYLRHVETPYHLQPLPEHDAVYFQFNQVRDADGGPTLAMFADSLRVSLGRTGARALIVDVRHNNGGNNGLLRPLLRALVWWEMDAPDHAIYVITSRNTFSAAQNFINRLERLTEAVFVGEPSSSRPNFTGEETNLTLPHSRVRGSISTMHWQDSDPDDERPAIVPDLPVDLRASDYFGGRDPALEAILTLIDRAAP